MMWFNVLSYYIILNMKKEKSHTSCSVKGVDKLGVAFLLVAAFETYVYYSMRWLYAMFLFVYASTLLGVTIWSARYAFNPTSNQPMHAALAKEFILAGCLSFFLVGTVCWAIDMHMCSALLPAYISSYGATLHIIWHVTAGYGGYLQTLTLVVARAGELGVPVTRTWKWAVVPIVVTVKGSAKPRDKIS